MRIRGRITMSAVDDAGSPLYLRSNEAGSGGRRVAPNLSSLRRLMPMVEPPWHSASMDPLTREGWQRRRIDQRGRFLRSRSFAQISTVAVYLAVATLLTALGRLAKAFPEARHAGEQAHLAQTDELTALPNRRGFYNMAAPILSGKGSSGPGQPTCALLLLDLNHFKDINDSLGHAAGDELLRRVAARLSASLRKEDILARLGGDEFALILPNVGIDRAVQAAAALTTALEQTVVLDGLHVQTAASIGIALGPEHGRDLGTLLRHADMAMYRAKHGHARYSVYTPDADERVTTRYGMELLAQLRDAIANR